MKIRTCGLLAAMVAAAALLCTGSQAAPEAKAKRKGAAAAGKVSKMDGSAKTFVVTNKKKGDFTVSFDDKTVFKKAAAGDAAPADATAADVKDGIQVTVQGKTEGTKVQATRVMIGGGRKKKNK